MWLLQWYSDKEILETSRDKIMLKVPNSSGSPSDTLESKKAGNALGFSHVSNVRISQNRYLIM